MTVEKAPKARPRNTTTSASSGGATRSSRASAAAKRAQPRKQVAGVQTPARTRRDPVDRATILDVALRLIDEQGLDAFTIRALASEVAVYPTTIQWHVGSKAQLLADVSAKIFDDLRLPNERDMDWVEWLRHTCHAWRDVFHAHPNIVPVISSHMVIKPEILPVVERVVGVIESAGFRERDLVNAYNSVIGSLVGWVNMELSGEPEQPDKSWQKEYARALQTLPPTPYPALTRNMDALENNAFMTRYESGRTRPMDESFSYMIDLLLESLHKRAPKARRRS